MCKIFWVCKSIILKHYLQQWHSDCSFTRQQEEVIKESKRQPNGFDLHSMTLSPPTFPPGQGEFCFCVSYRGFISDHCATVVSMLHWGLRVPEMRTKVFSSMTPCSLFHK